MADRVWPQWPAANRCSASLATTTVARRWRPWKPGSKICAIIVITPTASGDIHQPARLSQLFRANASDAVQARVDAGFLVNTLGAAAGGPSSITTQNTASGREITAGFAKAGR